MRFQNSFRIPARSAFTKSGMPSIGTPSVLGKFEPHLQCGVTPHHRFHSSSKRYTIHGTLTIEMDQLPNCLKLALLKSSALSDLNTLLLLSSTSRAFQTIYKENARQLLFIALSTEHAPFHLAYIELACHIYSRPGSGTPCLISLAREHRHLPRFKVATLKTAFRTANAIRKLASVAEEEQEIVRAERRSSRPYREYEEGGYGYIGHSLPKPFGYFASDHWILAVLTTLFLTVIGGHYKWNDREKLWKRLLPKGSVSDDSVCGVLKENIDLAAMFVRLNFPLWVLWHFRESAAVEEALEELGLSDISWMDKINMVRDFSEAAIESDFSTGWAMSVGLVIRDEDLVREGFKNCTVDLLEKQYRR